jgi:hypothetical protein
VVIVGYLVSQELVRLLIEKVFFDGQVFEIKTIINPNKQLCPIHRAGHRGDLEKKNSVFFLRHLGHQVRSGVFMCHEQLQAVEGLVHFLIVQRAVEYAGWRYHDGRFGDDMLLSLFPE